MMGTTKDTLKELLHDMEAFVSTKTVVGEPLQVGDMIILPLIDVSLGLGAGSREKEKYGNVGAGVGAKMSPNAVLVIKEGQVRLVNVKNQDTVTKALDLIPDMVNKFTGKNKEEDELIKEELAKQE